MARSLSRGGTALIATFYRFTRTGTALRAIADDAQVSMMAGIAWSLIGVVAVVAGVLVMESGPNRTFKNAAHTTFDAGLVPWRDYGQGLSWPAPAAAKRVKTFKIYRYDAKSIDLHQQRL